MAIGRFRVKKADKHTLKLRVLDWEKGPEKDDVLGQCQVDINGTLGCC